MLYRKTTTTISEKLKKEEYTIKRMMKLKYLKRKNIFQSINGKNTRNRGYKIIQNCPSDCLISNCRYFVKTADLETKPMYLFSAVTGRFHA